MEGDLYRPEASWEELPQGILGTGLYCSLYIRFCFGLLALALWERVPIMFAQGILGAGSYGLTTLWGLGHCVCLVMRESHFCPFKIVGISLAAVDIAGIGLVH